MAVKNKELLLFSFYVSSPRLCKEKLAFLFVFEGLVLHKKRNQFLIAASFLDLQASVNCMTCRMQIDSSLCPEYQTKLLQQNCCFPISKSYSTPQKIPGLALLNCEDPRRTEQISLELTLLSFVF